MTAAASSTDGLLRGACQPVFSLILGLLSGSEFGEATTLRNNIANAFAGMERRTRQGGVPAEEILSARFALTAFIDEAIGRSDWPGKTAWANNPLSLEYFSTNTAGVEFFDKLEALRQRPQANPDLLEVYYICLALGFEGKYALTDPRQLQALMESTALDLERVRGRSAELSPHWQPPEQVLAQVRNELPLSVIAAAGLGVIFVVFLIFRLLSTSGAQDIANGLRALM